jgi:hypothetical protein
LLVVFRLSYNNEDSRTNKFCSKISYKYSLVIFTVSSSESLRFFHSGISLAESETIYNILNKTFHVVEEDQEFQFKDSSMLGIVKINFPVPFCDPFFELFSEVWFSLKQVLKDMKRRRGKKGLAVDFSFTGFIQNEEIYHTDIIFQINDVSQKEFEMATEKIEYLVDVVSAELFNVQREMTSPVTYAYDPLRRKWLMEPRRIGFGANRG